MKIGIIIGSIREGRKGEAVGRWVLDAAGRSPHLNAELLDLKTFDVPLLTSATIPGQADRHYESPEVTRWSQAVDACTGFVFVTPEYNHGVPGAFKNAFDSLGAEWTDKTVAFVSYGADAGVRAVEHWRQIVSNFHMIDIRNQVALSLFTDFDGDDFAPGERRTGELDALLGRLAEVTTRVNA